MCEAISKRCGMRRIEACSLSTKDFKVGSISPAAKSALCNPILCQHALLNVVPGWTSPMFNKSVSTYVYWSCVEVFGVRGTIVVGRMCP